jgi:prevent-host-death family protein
MDRAISASDANQRFSELLREVQEGESFVVTSRGRPVARVTPIDDLERQGPAIAALLDFVAGLPRRHAEAWRREDLYE